MKLVVLAALVGSRVAADTSDIYSQSPSTVLGCQCAGPCSVGFPFKCNVNPVCKVKSKDCKKGTADWSITMLSYYDYCIYPSYESYESLSAAMKKGMVLEHVREDTTSASYPSAVSVLGGIMGESVMVSFNASADVFPEQRTKWIHSVGVVGGIRFVSSGNHPYTGLFQGAEHGMVRFSAAKQPGKDGVAPGMGVKFFRSGRPSSNFVAMYSLDGQPCSDGDFFAHVWSNHIPNTDNFGLKLIAAKFWQASYCPLMVGLSDLSSDASGTAGTFPFQLEFHPKVSSECPCNDYSACMANLAKVPVGSTIFEVRAAAGPKDAFEVIGSIVLTDALTPSKFGDEQLFFKHQHMEADFALRPAWLDAIDRKRQCGMGCTGRAAPTIDQGCTSPFSATPMLSTDAELVV